LTKGVITSSGRVIDLDSNNEVQSLPPESLQMEKRSYGFSQSFSAMLKNRMYYIKDEYGQWYCNPSGRTKLVREIDEMNIFPFDVFLKQNATTGDISYLTVIRINGIEHDVLLAYDYDHPDYEMTAQILRPILDGRRMGTHTYGNNKPCYIENWSRKLRAIHVAMQVAFWIDDYYKGKLLEEYCKLSKEIITDRSYRNYMQRMEELGLVRESGSGRWKKYEIIA